ncbi:hypothetical protein [Nonomuraea pusilla]|uniref:Uncharacterized protein n=1 Tax=Nonomuraea pusilla TaxID=46177 RepID=A0A1H8KCM3_9ACTN|nr:hypothetical protein [Nonomuraea pusilla]SEN90720.1 hypothetical protein SAMN05660976_08579 [Nonomuraea pusilla]
MLTAEQVLQIINGGEALELSTLELCVITGGYTKGFGSGPMAGEIVNLSEETFWPFERGEILIVDRDSGREPFGEGRKPAKWGVTAVYTGNWDEAWTLRREALSAPSGETDDGH